MLKRKQTILTLDEIDWFLDAAVSFGYSLDSDTTDHPIEDGSEISDHVDLKPLTFSLDGFMSEAPLTGSLLESFSDLFSSGQQWAFVEAIENARKNRTFVSLDANNRGSWDNLIITSFAPSWSAEVGDSVEFRMSLKQITVVESQTATVLSSEANLALSILQMFADPTSAVTGTIDATTAQQTLFDASTTYPGVSAGVDFVAGR